jgi:peptidase C39-like protein
MFDRPRRRTQLISGSAMVVLLGLAVGSTAVAVDAFGVGERFDHLVARVDRYLAGPPPDRPAPSTLLVEDPEEEEEPSDTPAPTPVPTPSGSLDPAASPTPIPTASPTPTPAPVRKAVDVNIVKKPKTVFASEIKNTWCAPAGVQMALAVLGLADTSDAFQKELQSKVRTWESRSDSHNGDWGPAAMALALEEYGAPGYEVRAYKTRNGALRDAAKAILATNSPVILLAWRGAHTWVMTGFRADADPSVFKDAKVSGTYVLDPWYPRISSIWGRSDPPGTFQNTSEMERNYLKWRRPEGHYKDRDDLYISVVPTLTAP